MSNRAISWALRQRAGSSGAKAVLIVLADMVRDEATQGWPAYHAWGTSLAALTEATEQDRKSVVTNLQRLEAAGLIVPAGKAGKTRQITVYRLPVPADFDRWNADRAVVEKSPENGKLPEIGTVPLLAGNSTVFPGKESRFSPESVPKTVHETLLNPIEPKEPVDDCPHQEIVAAFNATFPAAIHARQWTPARQTVLRARWREDAERQSVEWWSDFFRWVAKSKFLTGLVRRRDERRDFRLSLDWLLKLENFVKVSEGRYHDGAQQPKSDNRPDWATRAGFVNRFEAENAGCFEHNHHRFADGRQMEAA